MTPNSPIRPSETKDPYFAQGRAVFHRPKGGRMGFKLCTVGEFVEAGPGEPPPAEYIAQALNRHDAMLAKIEDEAALLSKAEELDRLAAMLGESDDPFAAWETLTRIIGQHRAMRVALEAAERQLSKQDLLLGADAMADDIKTLLAEVELLDDSVSQDRVTLMAEVSELEAVEP